MCDCVTYAGKSGGNGFSLFAKNSDREPNEIQIVERHPRGERAGKLKTTHVEVDYDGPVNETVISRPYWMWGAEMGFNEHGVSAGNEAIFTKSKPGKNGLLGMDLLRLSLEKGRNARDAASVISDYLERYGQGGSNSRTKGLRYNNSIMISDRDEALVMDLVGREWRIRRVRDYGSISNLSDDPDWLETIGQSGNFDLRHDSIYTPLGKGRKRQLATFSSLRKLTERPRPGDLMAMMRQHLKSPYHPAQGSNADVCMHSGPLTRINKTVSSMITETIGKYTMGWFTFSSNPCLSLYKPVIMGEGLEASIDYSRTYWLYAERIHRKLMFSPPSIFHEAMDQTLYNQSLITEVACSLRSRLLDGEAVTQEELNSASIAVMDIDRNHLLTLNSLAQPEFEDIRTGYQRWWDRTTDSLEPSRNSY